MATGSVRRRAALRRSALIVSLFAALLVAGPAPSASAAEAVVVIEGRGWGHGRGMSQWGSLGYAVDHGWDWRQILGHYYSNTTEGSLPAGSMISVRLEAVGGGDTIVARQDGGLRTSATGETTSPAWLVRPVGARYEIFSGPSCAGPWHSHGVHDTRDVRVFNPAGQHDTVHHSQLLHVCEPSGRRTWYRGDIHARRGTANEHRTVNVTTMERYLRGVVPRESPAGWGSVGGGRGMNALRAQAVTARSYAAAENRASYAKTCDTISCQVYSGAFQAPAGANPTTTEHPNTDRAIAETSGIVRLLGGSPARTEYSSSTGGWTAGGTFPAVEDLGDAYAGNAVHTWRVELRVAAIEARFPSIGRYTSMEVTRRNGLGADGGRVTEVVIRGSAGSVTRSGMQFRSDFMDRSNCTTATGSGTGCVKSDWFTPIAAAPATGVAVADTGFWVVRTDGTIEHRAGADWHGDMAGRHLNAPVLGMASNPAGTGYWMVAADGGIFTFGDVRFHGSTGATRLNQPIVGMASTAHGRGYWLVARDGGIFSFGDARFYGSTGAMRLNQPIVGMARTRSGRGYWLVARDGGIFTFGDARFHGSTGDIALNEPIVGMAPTPSGRGYWLVARDGGVFTFGDAKFYGSLAGQGREAAGIAPSTSGQGYSIVTADGQVRGFGDAA